MGSRHTQIQLSLEVLFEDITIPLLHLVHIAINFLHNTGLAMVIIVHTRIRVLPDIIFKEKRSNVHHSYLCFFWKYILVSTV